MDLLFIFSPPFNAVILPELPFSSLLSPGAVDIVQANFSRPQHFSGDSPSCNSLSTILDLNLRGLLSLGPRAKFYFPSFWKTSPERVGRLAVARVETHISPSYVFLPLRLPLFFRLEDTSPHPQVRF